MQTIHFDDLKNYTYACLWYAHYNAFVWELLPPVVSFIS